MNMGKARGFTLIELSIVLVIIGLIVGGILVGRNLIKSAEINALLSQMQKYQSAVYTFKTKYNNHIPGDMPVKDAALFGFFQCTWSACGQTSSEVSPANDDGKIYMGIPQASLQGGNCNGECSMFWRQLSDAKLIDGNFGADLNSQGDPVSQNSDGFYILSKYQPAAKFGSSYVAIANQDYSGTFTGVYSDNAFYFLTQGTAGQVPLAPTMTPTEAYSIDKKIDDGLPARGKFLVEAWGYFNPGNNYYANAAASGSCTYGTVNQYVIANVLVAQYNTSPSTGSEVVSCIPEFVMH